MILFKKALLGLTLLVSFTSLASAATLDFNEVAGYPSNASVINLSNANITHNTPFGGFLVTQDFPGFEFNSLNDKGSICALVGPQCLGSMGISFGGAIENLYIGFAGDDLEEDEEVIVSGWLNNSKKATEITIRNGGIYNFASLGIVDFIFLQNNSTKDSGGFLYQDFSFDYAESNVVATPLPAALPMFGAALALLGYKGWRRRKS
ncbi:hypothetical protein [Sneathiella limimaris]|uniref:hypothetical protein n=1 Tax=Sneathiella limimaris TaxID=1964213 RepID=UPI00146CC1A1|nr:hypothetical protein [Sneathiella limimaris]